MLQKLAAGLTTVVSYDRAGFGWSDAPAHGCTAADAARDLARCSNARNLPVLSCWRGIRSAD